MKPFNSIGRYEVSAASDVIMNGVLSGYLATEPSGGFEVRRLEADWARTFRTDHDVACNSATSGLFAACLAAEIIPGDEVIVSPYTMSATAAAPKMLGAKLVWCDINPWTYTMDYGLCEKLITKRTRAIIVTNLFGMPAHLSALRAIADAHKIFLIEDNAQAIFASERNELCGTIGHMGVFSLNVHKHLQVGEGGIVVTRDPDLDRKLRDAVNHGEMRGGILGLNLRMTEVTAAMAREQLRRAPEIMKSRLEFAVELEREVQRQGLWITTPFIRPEASHAFYVWGAQLKRDVEKVLPPPWKRGYMRPLYHLKALEADHVHLEVVERVESKMVLVEICAHDPSHDEIVTMVQDLGELL